MTSKAQYTLVFLSNEQVAQEIAYGGIQHHTLQYPHMQLYTALWYSGSGDELLKEVVDTVNRCRRVGPVIVVPHGPLNEEMTQVWLAINQRDLPSTYIRRDEADLTSILHDVSASMKLSDRKYWYGSYAKHKTDTDPHLHFVIRDRYIVQILVKENGVHDYLLQSKVLSRVNLNTDIDIILEQIAFVLNAESGADTWKFGNSLTL